MRNGKEEFDLQLEQGLALTVSGAKYRASSQQIYADANQHEFMIHMLGTCLGCQSDFQANQTLYNDLCEEIFIFLSSHPCFLFITKKSRYDGVQLLSC